jgi:hypothetical protein
VFAAFRCRRHSILPPLPSPAAAVSRRAGLQGKRDKQLVSVKEILSAAAACPWLGGGRVVRAHKDKGALLVAKGNLVGA